MWQKRPQHFIKKLFPQKISFKLALAICLLVFVLFSVLGLFITQVTRGFLEKTIRENHEKMARLAAREIAMAVERPVELLNTAARLMSRRPMSAWEKETSLVELSLGFPMFEEINAVSSEGRTEAASEPGQPVRSWQTEDAFQTAMKGDVYVSPIRIEEDSILRVTIAVPVREMGKVTDVLVARVGFRGFWDVIDELKIGRTGFAFLVSREGLILAHPDKKLVLRNTSIRDLPGFREFLAGTGKDRSLEFKDPKGREILATFAEVRGVLPLGVILQMDAREAYHLVGEVRGVIWWILVLALLAAVAVSFFLAGWLVRPVQLLREWSHKVALGDFDYRLRPESSDEIGRLFVSFRRMSERLKAAKEREHFIALGEAATTISHKLKNAIVSLKTFAQLFPQRKRDPRFLERFEKDFSANISHLERIFNNLSQISSTLKPQTELVQVRDILQNIHHTYKETLEKTLIHFQFESPETVPYVSGDGEQLRELFVNIIQNAIHAMPDGGELKVRVSCLAYHSWLQVVVRDSGFGIPEEHLRHIFKPFYTTKHGGMGLGLSISRKIAEEHGGRLTLESVEGEGTLVMIHLPYVLVEKMPAAASPELVETT